MQAVVVHSLDEGAHLEEVEIDGPGPGEVLVRVVASGVCGSDLHVLDGTSPVLNLPMVLGHEGAGVVEAVGEDVRAVVPGDHVVIALYGPCLGCRNCLSGNLVHCNGDARIKAIRGTLPDGSTHLSQRGVAVNPFVGSGTLAEYSLVRASQVVVVPPDVPLEVICLAGCGVTTGLGAVFNIAHVQPGDAVAVIGCGGVGLSVVQGARIAGATQIIAIDTNPAKLELAERMGATHRLQSGATPITEMVAELRPGGVDVAFEVVGRPELVAAALAITRPGGSCVMVGSQPPGSVIPVDARVLAQERRLMGCIGGSNIPARDIPRIVDLYRSGELRLDEMVTLRVTLAEFGEAFRALQAGEVARSVVTMER